MERSSAIILTIIFFFLFYLLSYYGARLTFLSSIVIATFISFILLNIFYPPNRVIHDCSDFTLILYGVIEVISIIIIVFYVAYMTLRDVRQC